MGSSTYTIVRLVCPNCGEEGELKLRPRAGHLYQYIDHYKTGNYYRNGNYLRSCYLGRIGE